MKLLNIIIIIIFFYSPHSNSSECASLFEAKIHVISPDTQRSSERRLSLNKFVISRGLWRYNRYLGTFFKNALKKLSNKSSWFDLGAGLANAQRDFAIKNPKLHTDFIAVSYQKPQNDELFKFERANPNFRYIDGNYFENLNLPIKTADLVTDLFGPLSYTRDITHTLYKSLNLLKEGGTYTAILAIEDTTALLTAMLRRDHMGGSASVEILNAIYDKKGDKIDFTEFFKKVRGVDILLVESRSSFLIDTPVIKIAFRRNSDTLFVPNLELSSYVDSSPPTRIFSWHD